MRGKKKMIYFHNNSIIKKSVFIAILHAVFLLLPDPASAGQLSDLINEEAPRGEEEFKAWRASQHKKIQLLIEEKERDLGLYLSQLKDSLFEAEGETKKKGMKIYDFIKVKRERLRFKEQYFLDTAGKIEEIKQRFQDVSISKYRSYLMDKEESNAQAYAFMKYATYSTMSDLFTLSKEVRLRLMDENIEAFLLQPLQDWSLREHNKRSQQLASLKQKIPSSMQSQLSTEMYNLNSSASFKACRERVDKSYSSSTYRSSWSSNECDYLVEDIRARVTNTAYNKSKYLLTDIDSYQPSPLVDLVSLLPSDKKVDLFLQRKADKWEGRININKSALIKTLASRKSPLVR
jgi:hypothetical protein